MLLPIIAACFFPGSVLAETPAHSAENVQLQTRIDWPKFFERLDPVSETLPAKFDEGTFVGNGMLGITFYRDGTENRLRFDIGRGDVTDHRPQHYTNEVGRGRLPIGYFTLTPAGKILDGEARIDIWNAETRGSVQTDRGRITFRAFCHARENVMVVDLATDGGEQDVRLEWHPAEAKPDGVAVPDGYEPNPPLETKTIEAGLTVSHQKLLVGGEYATATGKFPRDRARSGISSASATLSPIPPRRRPRQKTSARQPPNHTRIGSPATGCGGMSIIRRVLSASRTHASRAFTGCSSIGSHRPREPTESD